MTICPECGFDRPDIVEVPAETEAAETAADATVEIARIEADRDVTLAKVHAKTEESWQETRVAELEGKLAGMQELLDRLNPPEPHPEPRPVIVEPPAPA